MFHRQKKRHPAYEVPLQDRTELICDDEVEDQNLTFILSVIDRLPQLLRFFPKSGLFMLLIGRP